MLPNTITEFRGEYRFLSNFYESPIYYNGVIYKTNEHFFQAMKADNESDFLRVITAETPGEAKRLGRRISIRDDWDDVKLDYMLHAQILKYSQNHKLLMDLRGTAGITLLEGNNWCDNFWGVCSCEKCSEVSGNNYLGKYLMKVRYMFLNLKVDST